MTPSAINLLVEDARSMSLEAAAKILGLHFNRTGVEHPQPCPHCGGTDTFAFNTQKQKWNCRTGGAGGNDAIGMAAHCFGLDVHRRDGFLEACSIVLARPVPDETGSGAVGTALLERLEQRRQHNQAEVSAKAERQAGFRERERAKALAIYDAAAPVGCYGREVADYLEARGCGRIGASLWLRHASALPYWHGQHDDGRLRELHRGPAMVAPFIGPDLVTIGCHITWLDLTRPPKYRPLLVDSGTGDVLPTKKMRGSKKGGLIPLFGEPRATRWVGGEGIENGAAFAAWEGWRGDSFYFAAGDLGNLAGPAKASSRFAHPTLSRFDRKGVARPVMVAGPLPKADQDRDDAMWVADHVSELVLLADGDSERVMTAAAMARARARHARAGRLVPIVWPRDGSDFAGMAAGARA